MKINQLVLQELPDVVNSKTKKILNVSHQSKALLQFIGSVWNNHKRILNFISKFERLLRHFKEDIENDNDFVVYLLLQIGC